MHRLLEIFYGDCCIDVLGRESYSKAATRDLSRVQPQVL